MKKLAELVVEAGHSNSPILISDDIYNYVEKRKNGSDVHYYDIWWMFGKCGGADFGCNGFCLSLCGKDLVLAFQIIDGVPHVKFVEEYFTDTKIQKAFIKSIKKQAN